MIKEMEVVTPDYEYDGMQMVAMVLDDGRHDGTAENQMWNQWNYERKKRHPVHTRGRQTLSQIEPRPQQPFLTPQKSHFSNHDDYVHALRDWSLKVNTQHLHADKAAAKPGWLSRAADYVGWGNVAQVAATAGGVHPRLLGSGVQTIRDVYKMQEQRDEVERMTDFYDMLPKNVYLDVRDGHLVSMIKPLDELPERYVEYISDYEAEHGQVPNLYAKWHASLEELQKKLDEVSLQRIGNMVPDAIGAVLESLFAMAKFTEYRDQLLGTLGLGQINELGHLPSIFMIEQTDTEKKSYEVFGDLLGMDKEQSKVLAEEMPFTDFLAYAKDIVGTGKKKLVDRASTHWSQQT